MSRRFAALTVLIVGLATACGDQPGPDYGDYAIQPIAVDYDTQASYHRGVLTESLRIGERLVIAEQIDPDLSRTRGGGVIVDFDGIDEMLSSAQREALAPFDVLAGFGAIAGNDQVHNEATLKFLSIAILALPSEEIAGQAAAAMAASDFAANIDNAPLPVPEFGAALNHWRPGVPTVGSWLVWKNLVIRIYAKVVEPNPDVLTDLLTRTYRAQLAELDGFTSTPPERFAMTRMDPDGLLTRVVSTGRTIPEHQEFAVYGPRAFALLVGRPSARLALFERTQVTAVAVSHNKFLFRTGSPAAAVAYADELAASLTADYTDMAGVPELPMVRCHRALRPNPSEFEAIRFSCVVVHGEFVVRLLSNQDDDVRQMAAAQYALLAGTEGA
ncbi:hypothetical protein [Nocardia sp. NPDC058633]|uniref:DUF7373 family lipoprotein n=1 Tax=Nocardia sp. NPDC058633 TaxID=3346568 RepID=UPI0036547D53